MSTTGAQDLQSLQGKVLLLFRPGYLFFLTSFFLVSSVAFASGQECSSGGNCLQKAKSRSGSVMVAIRAVQAEKPEARGNRAEIDKRLQDISGELQKLHYRTFRFVDRHEEVVPFTRKQRIALANGHTLTVRPLYYENSRVCMWLRWHDSAGMEVLDTRMHFEPGRSMITGMDGTEDHGVILAIKVSPPL